MAGPASESEMVECPKGKVHLSGVEKGQAISFAIFPYREKTKCPVSMKCSDPCEYKKSI